MFPNLFSQTHARVAQWRAREDVLGVLLVGSKSGGFGDEFSDDDLEVVLTDDAFARLAPREISDVLIQGEGVTRKMIYDAEYLSLTALQAKRVSTHDLDHYPYAHAPLLFDRDGRVAEAVQAAQKMDASFRLARLRHATIDAALAPRRAQKTLRRGFIGAGHLLVARGAKALTRLLFALEWRWVPLDHWLERELPTLADPTHAAPLLVDALTRGDPAPLIEAIKALEPRLVADGVPPAKEWNALFLELVHPANAAERAVHGLD